MKPTVGLILGDPSGVGPEVAARVLARDDSRDAARVVLVADRDVFAAGQRIADVSIPVQDVGSISDADPDDPRPVLLHHRSRGGPDYTPSEATAETGLYAIETFRKVVDLALSGAVDSVCFAPLNKQAMNRAELEYAGGREFSEPLEWLASELEFDGFVGLISYLDGLWTSRVTNHVPIKDVSTHITERNIIDTVRLTHDAIHGSGIEVPRIAVSALNPHGGDGGLFGREEIDVIGPTIERLRADGLAVDGPYAPDTVYVQARENGHDAVVTMYHDQGQIAMKLLGFHQGVTIWAGMPIPIVTPAQGTAFDIVGKGIASDGALHQAFQLACRMGAGATAR